MSEFVDKLRTLRVIRHAGTPKRVVDLVGIKHERKEMIYVPETHMFHKVAPYDDHFIYENKTVGQPSYMCTCGSAAVIREDTGMFVCLFHATHGHHQGMSRTM